MIEMSSSNGTVLIVDDTPGNLALLSDTLSEANYRVLVATDGGLAIEQTQYLKPDIILLDVMMPGIDGFETCARLKADPATAAIPILFMTGMSELENLLRGFGEGALDYIVKPIRPAEVLARIEVHLSHTRNLRRAVGLLDHADFGAVAVNRAGRINWLTPIAGNWLTDCRVNDYLPNDILEWFRNWRELFGLAGAESEIKQFSMGLGVSIRACEHQDEFMLVLHGPDTRLEWNPETLREKLKLTWREAEILMWIARGKTNKDIGLILATSPRTVNKHLEHIFEKLGVSTRAAAVAMVLERA